jgi:hypothetical protein
MKLRWLLVVAAMLGAVSTASAMTRSAAPPKFTIPWGNSAGGSYINYPVPIPSQIGITNCLASITTGFTPLSMSPVSAGGCAPFGQDFNGILKQITLWNQWNSAGAVVPFDSAFAASIGGYPQGAVLSNVATPSCEWISQVDNNSSNPDTGGSGWTGACPGGGVGGTSTGGANAQIVSTTPFVLVPTARICWIAGFTNTSALQINVNGGGLTNVFQRGFGGLIALAGGEVHAGTVTCADYDGSIYELDTLSTNASLVLPNQTVSGGANVNTAVNGNLGTWSTGTLNLNCGLSPLQYLTDAGTFTINAPANDGSCLVQLTNTTGAVVPTFSGFTTSSNTGEAIDTTTGHRFVLSIWRINGVASYTVKSLQ